MAPFGIELEPSCLLSVTTNLTSLHLKDVDLEPRDLQPDGALGMSQLLQVVARLPSLRMLVFDCVHGEQPQQLSAFSALTASSNLRELRLLQDFEIPRAAWAHVFLAGQCLPHLHCFVAWEADLDSADISRLVSCCPALETLCIGEGADASLTPLKSLTALTSLTLGSTAVKPAAVRSDLAALVHLKELHFTLYEGPGDDAPSGLQHLVPLTALTNLTSLSTGWHMLELQSNVSHCQLACNAEQQLG